MRKILFLTLPPLAVILTGGAAWWFHAEIAETWQSLQAQPDQTFNGAPRPDPQTYSRLTADLKHWREKLAATHRSARNDSEREAAEHDARILLETALPEMMRCWLGTPWDFNGTAAKPGSGKIACGYFVSTVLMDAGFRVDRYRLAQQPSSNILRSFLPKEGCELTVGQPYDAFIAATSARQPGVYLTGLDTHVAFIVISRHGGHGQGNIRFIHSSGSSPWSVVDESPDQAVVLKQSKWRMLGNLTADRRVIRRWLHSQPIAVHRQ